MRIRRSVRPAAALKPKAVKKRSVRASLARKHTVFVPGFVAFDALGQMRYYSGVTGCFGDWQIEGDPERRCCIHFFDNFPTASVEMRAQRLAEFLLKKHERGEITEHDTITLIGHSTGGLDIRRLLWCLSEPATRVRCIAGYSVEAAERVHACIKRVVFLSVPQFGTAIADYVRKYRGSIQSWNRTVSEGLRFNKSPISEVRHFFAQHTAGPRSDLLWAVIDALEESDAARGDSQAERANEREARGELAQWLEHMIEDFDAIDDLRSYSDALSKAKPSAKSPAHFNADERAEELASWNGIRTQSYATVVPAKKAKITLLHRSMVEAGRGVSAPIDATQRALNQLSKRWYLAPFDPPASAFRTTVNVPSLATTVGLVNLWPDLPFKLAYAACARDKSEFCDPAAFEARLAPSAQRVDRKLSRKAPPRLDRSELSRADNDGIVNTLSMFWPYDERDPGRHETFLIEADHTDIIGHFRLKKRKRRDDRSYDAYDLLESGRLFDREDFEHLWRQVFTFAFGDGV